MDTKSSEGPPKTLSRRDALKLAGLTWATANLIEPTQAILKSRKKEDSSNLYTDWDLGWSRYITDSLQKLNDRIIVLPDVLDSRGERITEASLVESWLFFHGLELMFRNDNGVGLTLDVMKSYFSLPTENTIYNINTSPFKNDVSRAIDANMQDIISAYWYTNPNNRKWIRRDDNFYVSLQRQNKYNIWGNSQPLSIESALSSSEPSENQPFQFWFGYDKSLAGRDLARVLGQQSEWILLLNPEVKTQEDLIEKIEGDHNQLSIMITPKTIVGLYCVGQFDSKHQPFQDLPTYPRDLVKSVRQIVNALGNNIPSSIKPMYEIISSKMEEFSRKNTKSLTGHLIDQGYISLSQFEKPTNNGEVYSYPLDVINITSKAMDILEKAKLAQPITVVGAFVPQPNIELTYSYQYDTTHPFQKTKDA